MITQDDRSGDSSASSIKPIGMKTIPSIVAAQKRAQEVLYLSIQGEAVASATLTLKVIGAQLKIAADGWSQLGVRID